MEPLLKKILLLTIGLLLAGHVTAGADNPPAKAVEFEAVYKVRASVASGEMFMSLTADSDGGFLFRTLTRPRGLVRMFARGEIDEQSRILITDESVVPLDYTLRDTISKDHDADLRFDWDGGIVVGLERGEEVSGELEPGMLNRAALYVAIMRDLQSERLPDEYVLFDRGRAKAYQLEKLGSEVIEVPFGEFEAVKLARNADDSRRIMYLWCAPALDYLPIRIELYKDDKRVSRAELRAVSGLSVSDS